MDFEIKSSGFEYLTQNLQPSTHGSNCQEDVLVLKYKFFLRKNLENKAKGLITHEGEW